VLQHLGHSVVVMFDLAMLAIAAGCFAVIFAVLYALDRI
jgi:hypothetical protein